MKLKSCARAFALTAFFLAPLSAGSVQAAELALTQASQPRINIARVKNVLNLTAEQRAYWPPVEAALRELARRQAVEANGLIDRVSNFMWDSRTIARLGAAARPLVRVLDERQKSDAIMLCREMGLGQVLAALI